WQEAYASRTPPAFTCDARLNPSPCRVPLRSTLMSMRLPPARTSRSMS
ncbi:MAG: hypothetical protein AVDCRST_MAG26-2359, partial [uncultured Chloroflexia bacterium]